MSLAFSFPRLMAILVLALVGSLAAPSTAALAQQDAGADQPIGFGQDATGGTTPFTVTSLDSHGPGTLADAVSVPGRLITFGVSGTIHLPNKLPLASDTTITGAGADIIITGRPLVLDGINNVVIRWLTRQDSIGSNDDGVQVINGTTDVWLDHLTLSGIHDEAIEVSQGATNVTISWVRMHDQDRGILVGNKPDHSDGADPSHVTVHHSWFDNVQQRQPRAVRWANLHAFNNVIEGWGRTAMSAAQQGELLSESNVLIRGRKGAGLITRAGQGKKNPLEGLARSVGDLTLGGLVRMDEQQPELVFTPTYDYVLQAADTAMADEVRAGAGASGSASAAAGSTSTGSDAGSIARPVHGWSGELQTAQGTPTAYYGRLG